LTLPLIIGQAPAKGNNGKPPFAGKSGARLARLAGLGETGDVLPEHFELVNLNRLWPGKKGKGDDFDMVEARSKAADLKIELQTTAESRFVLLMGRKVGDAFGWDLEYLEPNIWHNHIFILFPHPSGANHWWNDPENVVAARAMLKWVRYASSQ